MLHSCNMLFHFLRLQTKWLFFLFSCSAFSYAYTLKLSQLLQMFCLCVCDPMKYPCRQTLLPERISSCVVPSHFQQVLICHCWKFPMEPITSICINLRLHQGKLTSWTEATSLRLYCRYTRESKLNAYLSSKRQKIFKILIRSLMTFLWRWCIYQD